MVRAGRPLSQRYYSLYAGVPGGDSTGNRAVGNVRAEWWIEMRSIYAVQGSLSMPHVKHVADHELGSKRLQTRTAGIFATHHYPGSHAIFQQLGADLAGSSGHQHSSLRHQPFFLTAPAISGRCPPYRG